MRIYMSLQFGLKLIPYFSLFFQDILIAVSDSRLIMNETEISYQNLGLGVDNQKQIKFRK